MFRRISCSILVALALVAAPTQSLAWTTEELASQVADALGGRDRLAAIEGYQMEAEVEGMGLSGRAVTSVRFPAQQRNELLLGPLAMLMVLDDDEGWFRDHNGHVVTLTADQLADATTAAWIDAWRPWIDPVDPQLIRLDGEEQVDGLTCPVLALKPPGGNEFHLAIDPERFLPVKQIHDDESGIGREIVLYRDYREIDGVWIPYTVESYNDQLPDNRTLYRVVANELVPPEGEGLFLRPEALADVVFEPGALSVELPLRYHSGHLFVDVQVVGDAGATDATFMLDTGATLSLLDRSVALEMGLETHGDLTGLSIGGTMEVELVRVPFFNVAGVLLQDQVIGVADLKEAMSMQLGVGVVGILGYDFFSRFVVTLDYAAGACTLQQLDSWTPPDTGTVLPLVFMDQQPTVRAAMDHDLTGLWRLDTGADGMALHGPAAAAWNMVDRHGPGQSLTMLGLGGETEATLVRVTSFKLGPYVVDQPLVLLVGEGDGVLDAEAIVGNLGNSVLDRFVLTVDFAGQRLHLLPGPQFAHADRIRTVDVLIGWAGSRVEVLAVEPGGDAQQRGLSVGQEVLRIGGRPASRWTEAEFRRLWSGETEDSVLLVVKDDEGRYRIRLPIPPAP